MSAKIHPTAIVDPRAELGDGVEVGPYATIGPEVVIGDGSEVGAHSDIRGPATLGRENVVFPHAAIGFDPQDLKYKGERTALEIGDRNTFREFCSINRGTAFGGGTTSIGDDNLFMTMTHVGHDCRVGSRTVFTNGGVLAGHVQVGDDATIGAYSAVRQFCRVGRHAYIGGYSVITMDALPFAITVGQKPRCMGLNRIGLERKGVPESTRSALEKALRILLRSRLNTSQAIERLRAELPGVPEVAELIDFIGTSERGFIKSVRKGSRGGGAD